MLKRWLKQVSARTGGNKNSKINQAILLLVQKVESNAKWIEERRANVTYTPRNRAEVESFLKDVNWESTPLGAFVKSQRKLREERAKIVEEGRREEEKQRAKDKADKDGDEQMVETFASGSEDESDGDDGDDDAAGQNGDDDSGAENEEEDEDENEEEWEDEDEEEEEGEMEEE